MHSPTTTAVNALILFAAFVTWHALKLGETSPDALKDAVWLSVANATLSFLEEAERTSSHIHTIISSLSGVPLPAAERGDAVVAADLCSRAIETHMPMSPAATNVGERPLGFNQGVSVQDLASRARRACDNSSVSRRCKGFKS